MEDRVWGLTVDRPRAPILDADAIDDHRMDDGLGFPPSYVSFVREFGWGRLFGLWLIYTPVPAGFGDGVLGRGRRLTEQLRDAFRESQALGYDWIVEPRESWDVTKRLTVFATSENGDYLAWDTGSRDGRLEMPIYHTTRFNSLTRIGSDLFESIEWLRDLVVPDTADEFDFETLSLSPL
ncbi:MULTISPECIES: hypothetical protein [Microbacterium]|uniref:Knr4/Smi1-like domain-containing protein n=1 Tax=Microbacterium oxydans TaxID=82380 RepID=A0A3Q9J382_9MICO|nr:MULTISPECIES: hypothetical protein [Microbacterium]AZS38909.1 hypothetical protein CVS54_00206 [Microbacterium oxydans]